MVSVNNCMQHAITKVDQNLSTGKGKYTISEKAHASRSDV